MDWATRNPEYPGSIRRLPIKKIVIGPSLEYEPNKQAISSLLQGLGYGKVKILQSQIPYRI